MFSKVQGRLQVARGGVELRPRSFLELRGSSELQNGGLRALGEAWMTTFSRPSLKDRVLRLLAEATQSSQLSDPRTGGDISRGSRGSGGSGGSGGLSFIAPNASPRDGAKFVPGHPSRIGF